MMRAMCFLKSLSFFQISDLILYKCYSIFNIFFQCFEQEMISNITYRNKIIPKSVYYLGKNIVFRSTALLFFRSGTLENSMMLPSGAITSTGRWQMSRPASPSQNECNKQLNFSLGDNLFGGNFFTFSQPLISHLYF